MGTWPGNPPSVVPDFANVKPGDFEPEPNWRSMYYAEKESHAETRRQVSRLRQQVRDLTEDLDDLENTRW